MKTIVVGSGPGGSTAAMVLADAGWDVVVLERGIDHFGDLTDAAPRTLYSNDELKMRRGFGQIDPELEPRTFRYDDRSDEPVAVGDVNDLPIGVGGGTTQWDAKTPRFWDIDFAKASMLGPIEGADVVDWPVTYDDMVPYYEVAEELLGVAGDVDAVHETPAGRHARHRRPFPMPPGVPMLGALALAEGARKLGLHPIPFPEAINSQPYDGRPPCISCGHCAGYGCPIHDRGSALVPLRRALLTGRCELRSEAMVTRVRHDGRRASAVEWVDRGGRRHVEAADLVVLAGGPVESVRLALLSEAPDPAGWLGRGLMYHWFTMGFGVWLDRRMHANRGRDVSHAVYDFCDPDLPGARDHAREHGLPYFRGGVVEMGGAPHPIDEAFQYVDLLEMFEPERPFGRRFKELMRESPMRDRLVGAQMIAEDLPQLTNRIDLDPKVRDHLGRPVARITYRPHRHELVAQDFYLPMLRKMIDAAGAGYSGAIAQAGTEGRPSPTDQVTPMGMHTMGGLRMGADPTVSATDEVGRLRGLDNVGVADGSVLPTSGAHNPTLTIVAMAWRDARAWAGLDREPQMIEAGSGETGSGGGRGGGSEVALALGGAAALTAGAGAAVAGARHRRRRHGEEPPAYRGSRTSGAATWSSDVPGRPPVSSVRRGRRGGRLPPSAPRHRRGAGARGARTSRSPP